MHVCLNRQLVAWCDGLHHKFLSCLVVCYSYVIVVAVYSDQCSNPTEDTLASHMSPGTSPKGSINAGKYAKITGKCFCYIQHLRNS